MLGNTHLQMLATQSAIDVDVIEGRGYETLEWSENDQVDRGRLRDLRISPAGYRPLCGSGLLIPIYGPNGDQVSVQWRPDFSVIMGGKEVKYLSPIKGGNKLDIHPSMTERLKDVKQHLFITEGVKKADSLASRGKVVIGLSGIWNWKSKTGAIGDWEDVPLKGRTVTILFDSDGRENRSITFAMKRLGSWLESRGVKTVNYLLVPEEFDGKPTKGVDDYFVAGGTWDQLSTHSATSVGAFVQQSGQFTDAMLAERVAMDVLEGEYCFTESSGWMKYTGKVWKEVGDAQPIESIRLYAAKQFGAAVTENKSGSNNSDECDGWERLLGRSTMTNVLMLCRGIDGIYKEYTDFDIDNDKLNCQNGLLDLATGDLIPHSADQLVTKITKVDYEPEFKHSDWDKALQAIPEDVMDWAQIRYGQGITGHMPSDDVMVIEYGRGSNGKSTIVDGIAGACGDYFRLVSNKILMANDKDTPTEFMDLKGLRFAQLEETPEARRLDVNKMKQSVGTSMITARPLYKKSVTFSSTHSMFISTNNIPIVSETDDGTWRRLKLFKFPFSFKMDEDEIRTENDRRGEEGLKERVKINPEIHKAALFWLVDGAIKWYAAGRIMPKAPARIVEDTREWRNSSDLVLAFFNEKMVIDAEGVISTKDLLEEVNQWLIDTGHRPWNIENVTGKFSNHGVLISRNVKKAKVYASKVNSRPNCPIHALGNRPNVLTGMRFRTKDDVETEEI